MAALPNQPAAMNTPVGTLVPQTTEVTPDTIAQAKAIMQQPTSDPPLKAWAADILKRAGGATGQVPTADAPAAGATATGGPPGAAGTFSIPGSGQQVPIGTGPDRLNAPPAAAAGGPAPAAAPVAPPLSGGGGNPALVGGAAADAIAPNSDAARALSDPTRYGAPPGPVGGGPAATGSLPPAGARVAPAPPAVAPAAAPPAAGVDATIAQLGPEVIQNVRERLAAMPPQQREELLRNPAMGLAKRIWDTAPAAAGGPRTAVPGAGGGGGASPAAGTFQPHEALAIAARGDPQVFAALVRQYGSGGGGGGEWSLEHDANGNWMKINKQTGEVVPLSQAQAGQQQGGDIILTPNDPRRTTQFAGQVPADNRTYRAHLGPRGWEITPVDEREAKGFEHENQLATSFENNQTVKNFRALTDAIGSMEAAFGRAPRPATSTASSRFSRRSTRAPR